jgi:hypothetical protein
MHDGRGVVLDVVIIHGHHVKMRRWGRFSPALVVVVPRSSALPAARLLIAWRSRWFALGRAILRLRGVSRRGAAFAVLGAAATPAPTPTPPFARFVVPLADWLLAWLARFGRFCRRLDRQRLECVLIHNFRVGVIVEFGFPFGLRLHGIFGRFGLFLFLDPRLMLRDRGHFARHWWRRRRFR